MLEPAVEPQTASGEAARAAAEAKVYADQGQWDEARAAMARAIDADANVAGFHALMGWYTSQSSLQPVFERQRLAEHHLGVALEMDPQSYLAHYYQGLIWTAGGNTTRARIALNTVLSINPKFQPATQALERINKGPAQPSASDQVQRPAAFGKRVKNKRIVPLAIATALVVGVGGGALYFLTQPSGAADLARQLGTHLSIASASRAGSGGQDLYVDFGKAWQSLARPEQEQELHTIANGAKNLGITNVFVFSQTKPVGEIHGDAICVGDCVPQPAVDPGRGGGQAQATLKVPQR
jgi:tetratricopeptide (TPR) repeat protein